LSNLLRGRIEDISGWARFNQDKLDEAVDHLKRAVTILPEGTPAARTSLWHLGAALERQDKKAEALSYYIKSYNAGEPDPVRRTVIEQLYRKVNGSLEGLEERIGPAAASPVSAQTTPPENTPEKATDTSAPVTSTPESTPTTTPAAVTPVAEASPSPAPDSSPAPPVSRAIEPPTQTPQPTPTPELAPASSSPSPSPSPGPPATPVSSPSPDVSPASSISNPTPSAEATPSPVKAATQPRATLAITGKVKDSSDSPLANVVVVLISPQGTVLSSTTDDQGNYSFTVAPSSSTSSYRIIPSKDGLVFEPIDRVVSVVSDDVKELNFVGTPNRKP
jgi:hypothetical protein